MTTIAYKDGVIAYDSRMTSRDIVVDDEFQKMFVNDDMNIFYCGNVGDLEEFVNAVFNDVKVERYLDCESFLISSNKLYALDICDNRVRRISLRLDNHYAIGSGRRLSLAYMDTGMTAEEAVRATCKRDIYTGGTIRTFKIDR
jgi:20S proteasome alpha/beta subunit